MSVLGQRITGIKAKLDPAARVAMNILNLPSSWDHARVDKMVKQSLARMDAIGNDIRRMKMSLSELEQSLSNQEVVKKTREKTSPKKSAAAIPASAKPETPISPLLDKPITPKPASSMLDLNLKKKRMAKKTNQ